MAQRVTLQSLDQKIDYFIAELKSEKEANKLNTEFRLKANGVIATVALICTIIGGLITQVIGKLIR